MAANIKQNKLSSCWHERVLGLIIKPAFPTEITHQLKTAWLWIYGQAGGCNNSFCCKQRFLRTPDSFPPPHAKQHSWIVPGLCHIPHGTRTQTAPRSTFGNSLTTLHQHLTVGLVRHWAKPVGREHGWQANTGCWLQREVSGQDTCTEGFELLHSAGTQGSSALFFNTDREIKLSRVQPGRLDNWGGEWSKYPSASKLPALPTASPTGGKQRPWWKVTTGVTADPEPPSCSLARSEHYYSRKQKHLELRDDSGYFIS